MTRSKSCFVHLCIVLLTVETILGVSAVSLRARRETQSEKDDEPRGESRAGGGKGGSHGETHEDGNANDDSKSDDEKTDDGGWWNTTFGVLMYFIMVLFFALQVTLLIFCLGIFFRNVCYGNRVQTSSSTTTSAAVGQINIGHTPDAFMRPLDEHTKLIIQHLKDPTNEKVILLFEPSAESPIVNNWVGDASADIETLDRPSSRVSTTTLDSNVSVISSKHLSKWICSICLSHKMTSLSSLPCMHAFHKTCLHDFVLYSLEHNMAIKCPICRAKVKVNLSLK